MLTYLMSHQPSETPLHVHHRPEVPIGPPLGLGGLQLRLILQSTLTCEVSDASSTAPHLRRARIFDEGGRGLLLVAQFTQRWGTRLGREGKVIWAEQALPTGSGPTT
jgi:hypothetical protein